MPHPSTLRQLAEERERLRHIRKRLSHFVAHCSALEARLSRVVTPAATEPPVIMLREQALSFIRDVSDDAIVKIVQFLYASGDFDSVKNLARTCKALRTLVRSTPPPKEDRRLAFLPAVSILDDNGISADGRTLTLGAMKQPGGNAWAACAALPRTGRYRWGINIEHSWFVVLRTLRSRRLKSKWFVRICTSHDRLLICCPEHGFVTVGLHSSEWLRCNGLRLTSCRNAECCRFWGA